MSGVSGSLHVAPRLRHHHRFRPARPPTFSRQRRRPAKPNLLSPCSIPLNEVAGYAAGAGLASLVLLSPRADAIAADATAASLRLEKGQGWLKRQEGRYERFEGEERGGQAGPSRQGREEKWVTTAPGAGLVGRVWKKTLRQLSSFPLALVELAVLAALSALGTTVEQDLPPEAYAAKFGAPLAECIRVLGLDHMFTSFPFLATGFLLAGSLAACSYTRQLPMVRIARRWSFFSSAKGVQAQEEAVVLRGVAQEAKVAMAQLAGALAERKFQVFTDGNKLYAYRGLGGRVAPIAVHVALLAIMGGATWGALAGAGGEALVPVGEVVRPVDVLRQRAGPFYRDVADESLPLVQVNDFRIEYMSNGDVDQFYSDLSLVKVDREVEKAQLVDRKTIRVNVPLRFDGVSVYQTTWGISSIEIELDGEPLVLPMAKLDPATLGVGGDIWGAFIPLGGSKEAPNPNSGSVVIARDFQTVFVYNSDGSFAGARRPDSGKELSFRVQSKRDDPNAGEGDDGTGDVSHKIVVKKLTGKTGLQIKEDPGVTLVYVGFAALLISTLLSYESHSQVWAFADGSDGSLSVGGKSNRAKVGFKDDFYGITADVERALTLAKKEEEMKRHKLELQ